MIDALIAGKLHTAPAQHAQAIQRRRQIWEALHPSDKGGKTVPTLGGDQQVGFASDTANVAGESKRSINQHLARADALGDDLDRTRHRNIRECWSITPAGRAFAGIPIAANAVNASIEPFTAIAAEAAPKRGEYALGGVGNYRSAASTAAHAVSPGERDPFEGREAGR